MTNVPRYIRNYVLLPRYYSKECAGSGSATNGLVLGAYRNEENCEYKFTPTGAKVNETTGGKLKELITGTDIKKGNARVFTNVSHDFSAIAIAGLGPEGVGWNDMEKLDECKENIRIATAHGTRALQDEGISQILIEPFTNVEAAAESAFLSTWRFQDFRNREHVLPRPRLDPYENPDAEAWERGKIKGENQNLARRIEDTPGNMMTPTKFAEIAIENVCSCGVSVEARDKDWLETKRMNAFLTVSRGSCEPPLLLEVGYCGGAPNAAPLIFIGNGVTFDSGGMCLKKCQGMSAHRGDVAGAAVILAVIKSAAQMALPLNIIGLLPLCENLPGGWACKPGDIVTTMTGRTITIEDTDNEERVMLADALSYSGFFKPCMVIEVSTLVCSGIRKCLGTSSTGAFVTSEEIWKQFERAGGETGDRLWRMPLWKIYNRKNKDYLSVDYHNVGKGGNCAAVAKAAAFVRDFSPIKDFVHLDITGTGMLSNGVGHPYLREGFMTGRPTRTLVQFLYQIACPHTGEVC